MKNKRNFFSTLFFIIAVIAIIISILSISSKVYNSKLDVYLSKYIDLNTCTFDSANIKPCIIANVLLTNNSRRIEAIKDMKLLIKINTDKNINYVYEFFPYKESEISLTDNSIQKAILPFIILGKTSIKKRIVFIPKKINPELQFDKLFNVKIILYTQYNNKWYEQCKHYEANISSIWNDFLYDSTFQNRRIELSEFDFYRTIKSTAKDNGSLKDYLSLSFSFIALLISSFSLIHNATPVIAYSYNVKEDNYYIKNYGNGTALNIIVYYRNDTELVKGWKNPVNCFSLEPGGIIQLDWGLDEEGNLCKKGSNAHHHLGGVTEITVLYTSRIGFLNIHYRSKCNHDKTNARLYIRRYIWKHSEIPKIYNIVRKSNK